MQVKKSIMHAIITYFAFGAIIILLAGSSNFALAISGKQQTNLPDFLIRDAKYMSIGNATEEARIISQMAKQEQAKQQMIELTKGEILRAHRDLSCESTSYMETLCGYTIPTYDIVTNEIVGLISNPSGLEGTGNNDFAYLFTDGWNENYSNPIGGEAFAWGSVAGNDAYGQIFVEGYTDQPSWDNYVIIWVSNDPYSSWDYLGYSAVTSTSNSLTYICSTSQTFQYIAVQCWTPPPYPDYYSPLTLNSVYLDSIDIAY